MRPRREQIAASSALPGLFPPVQVDGRWYVDGALKKTLHDQGLGGGRRLHPADVAATTVGDARLGDLGVVDDVGAGDILRPHDAGHCQLAHLAIGAHLLAALDDRGLLDLVCCDRLGSGDKWQNIAKRRLADLACRDRPAGDRHAAPFDIALAPDDRR